MAQYSAEILSQDRTRLDYDVGLPESLLAGLNKIWISENKNVASILTPLRNDSTWSKLGNLLIGKCCNTMCYGFLYNGVASTDYRKLLYRFMNSTNEGYTNIFNNCSCNSQFNDSYNSELTLITIRSSKDIKLLENLWDVIKSDQVNECEVMLVSYNNIICNNKDNSHIYNIDEFLNTLGEAASWIIPMDGNIGFYIGYTDSENNPLAYFTTDNTCDNKII